MLVGTAMTSCHSAIPITPTTRLSIHAKTLQYMGDNVLMRSPLQKYRKNTKATQITCGESPFVSKSYILGLAPKKNQIKKHAFSGMASNKKYTFDYF